MRCINFTVVFRSQVLLWIFLLMPVLLFCQTEKTPNSILQLEQELEHVSPELKAKHLNQIASGYLSFNSEKSLKYAELALEQAISTGNISEEILANFYLGRAFSELLMNEKAISHFKQALEKANASVSDTIVSNIQFALGDSYYQMNNFSEALGQILNSADIEEKLNRQPQLAKRYKYLGKIYHASGDYSRSMIFSQKAIEICEKFGNKQSLMNLYNDIGIVYSDMGNYNKTLDYYQKSLNIAEELNDLKGKAKSLNNIGIVYYESGNYEKALEFYQKSLKIEEELKNKEGIGRSFNNIGIIYSDWKQDNLAIDYYKRALEIMEEYDDVHGMAMAYNNIGESFHELGDTKQALEYLFKSLKMEQSLSNKHGIADSYNTIGSVYFDAGNYDQALVYNNMSYKIADSLKLSPILLLDYELFYKIYNQKKDYKRALDYYTKYTAQKDSIYNLQLHSNLAAIQARYEVERLEKEKAFSDDRNNMRINEVKTQRLYLIIVFVLLIIFGFLVYFDIKTKIKANQKLKQINDDLTAQQEELTRAMEELSRNEAKYRNLLEYSPTGIVYLDKKGKILELNKKMADILGSPDIEETRKINCLEFPPLQEIGLSDDILKCIATHEMVFNEKHYRTKWGKSVDLRYYITPIVNRKGNVSTLFITVEDVSVSKAFERSKKLSELKYKILVENSLQAMLVVQDTKLVFANSRMEDLSQYKIDELKSSDDWLRIIIHPDDYERVKSNINGALSNKRIPAINEYKYIRKDGTVRWLESLGSVVEYDDKPAILVVAIDVTERKEAESILIESEKQLRKANAMKDKFFSIIAHDLKNPFNAILGFSSLLYEAYDNFDDQQRKSFIKNICDASDSTFKLLQNLLEWSRTQTGKIEFYPETIDVASIVNENITVLKSAAKNKKIILETNIDGSLVAFADSNMVKAIIRNLVSNAIKFTHPGGRIEVNATNSGNEVAISVSDSGIGITSDDISRLFRIDDPFRTVGTAQEEGSGLGLILCKEFVEKNNGKIWVESSAGVGSKFSFTLPSGANNLTQNP